MLTFFKQIFVWWNQQTLGTRIQTIIYGKFVGQDSFGNKYYQSKSGKRWVIYKDEIDASKIPSDWYSWMHYTKNKIENLHDLKKYEWQKPHLSNQTGTEKSYHPNKENNEQFVQITILDKVSSKSNKLEVKIGKEKKFKNLLIKALKCKNSEFDDYPEVTAYLQVKDTSKKSNDEVFVFNGWTFSSSPSIRPFDHPVYDIWLTKCY